MRLKPPTRRTAACILVTAIGCMLAGPASAAAGSLTLECARADVVNPVWNGPLTFAYEGADRGTLKVGGVFGEFAIPATRAPLQIMPGEMGEAIDGNANAHVKLPALPDVEACIDAQGAAEGDAYANARDACLQKLPPAPSGVDAVAQIRLGITGEDDSGEDAFVVFKLKYDAPSKAPDGKMVIEAFPAQCTLKK
jgi:hypothetical protein